MILTLVFLVAEVRTNTLALRQQAMTDRAQAFSAPFFENDRLASIVTGMKEVDGWAGLPYMEAFVGRYGLPIEDAILHERYLGMLFAADEADFLLYGPTPALEARLRFRLQLPDVRLLWDTGAQVVGDPAFREYVEQLRS